MDANGKSVKRLTDNAWGASHNRPCWSPDGKYIACGKGHWMGPFVLCIVDADGQNERDIADNVAGFAWGP
jgi:Tol biopolymer transport system component